MGLSSLPVFNFNTCFWLNNLHLVHRWAEPLCSSSKGKTCLTLVSQQIFCKYILSWLSSHPSSALLPQTVNSTQAHSGFKCLIVPLNELFWATLWVDWPRCPRGNGFYFSWSQVKVWSPKVNGRKMIILEESEIKLNCLPCNNYSSDFRTHGLLAFSFCSKRIKINSVSFFQATHKLLELSSWGS